MKLRCATLIAILCSVSLSSSAASCLHYEGDALTLSGRVVLKTFFGPPNYGENPETDSRETQGILILPKPVCVNADKDGNHEAEKNQSELTLVPPKGVNLKRFAAKQVVVHGTLFHADNGHHHTPVLMIVTRIEAGRK
jgi:hypothetical protein